jgi:predicted RNA binding protein YcfA (HicA-like mRNA interferase family)
LVKLPVVSGRKTRQALARLGWQYVHHVGSHMILVKPGSMATISVPDHKELDTGTLRAIVRQAGLTVEEFVAALRTH